MFVIFKNNEGGYSVRPAWIGFIKKQLSKTFTMFAFLSFHYLLNNSYQFNSLPSVLCNSPHTRGLDTNSTSKAYLEN